MGRYYKRIGKALGVILLCLLLAAGGYLYWSYSLEDDKIWSPYMINDVSIQGMTKEAAADAVKEKFEQDYCDSIIHIKLADEIYEINVSSLLQLDVENLIDGAYLLGHTDWYLRGYEKWQLEHDKIEKVEYHIIPDAENTDSIGDFISETGIQEVDTHKETEWELTEHSLVIQKGMTGVIADLEILEENIIDLLNQKIYTADIDCPVIEIEADPIDLEEIEKEIHVDPVDSEYNKYFEPSDPVTGVSFDVKAAEKTLEEAEEGSQVVIEFEYTEPEITKEELQSRLYKDELTAYQTTASTSNVGRATNITLASNSCNGVIIYPGETFSYNETLGERTAEKGYQAAGVYANGQLVQGIGGGICQLSSTIYAATFGLTDEIEIVERYAHSGPVAYVPRGMDATVSWGTLDLKFKNNMDYPIKLETTFVDGVVTVKFWGTQKEEQV